MKIDISVAMATYNGAKFIQQQLDSIAGQSQLPCELVVCDDRSQDDTVELVRRFAATAPFPVRLVENEKNLGFANNFMKAAHLCRGEWIAFCDQDDVWLPEKLATIQEVIARSRARDLVMVCHSAHLVDEDLTSTGRRLPDIRRDTIRGRNSHYGFWVMGGCITVFRADLLAGVDSALRPRDNFSPDFSWHGMEYPWLPHDKWICMLANALGSTAYVSRPLSCYRRHGSALTGSHDDAPLHEKVKQSVVIAPDYYQFQAEVASESAASLRRIGNSLPDAGRRERLLAGAQKFDRFSQVRAARARLYRSAGGQSLALLLRLLRSGGYFGSRFYALGWKALVKDTGFSLGLFGRGRCSAATPSDPVLSGKALAAGPPSPCGRGTGTFPPTPTLPREGGGGVQGARASSKPHKGESDPEISLQ